MSMIETINDVNNSWNPTRRTKIEKNNKKLFPFTTKKIDKGKIIIDVKILFWKLVIFFQSFSLY